MDGIICQAVVPYQHQAASWRATFRGRRKKKEKKKQVTLKAVGPPRLPQRGQEKAICILTRETVLELPEGQSGGLPSRLTPL